MTFLRILAVLCMGFVLTAASCSKSGSTKVDNPPAADPNSLYTRLGGKPAITAVVDKFIEYVAADERINAFFIGTVTENRVPHLKQQLVDQICEVSGGPCKYTGKDMVTAHTGMNIKPEHFQAMVEDLVRVLNEFKVPQQEQTELLTALAATQKDIVGK